MAPRVFVSYVRDNQPIVNRLVADLRRRGVDVWFDRDHLPVGTFWRDEIRKAVRDHEFFLACFSEESGNRERAFMREELQIALSEIRLRGNAQWFLPVLLSGEIPDVSIGPTQSIRDIQFIELTESNWAEAIDRICLVLRGSTNEVTAVTWNALHVPDARAGALRAIDHAKTANGVSARSIRHQPLAVLLTPNIPTLVMLAIQWVLAVFTVTANWFGSESTLLVPFWVLPLGYLVVRFVTAHPIVAGVAGGIAGSFIGVGIGSVGSDTGILPDAVLGLYFGGFVSWYMARPVGVAPITAIASTLLLLAGLGVFSALDYYRDVLVQTPSRPFVMAAIAAVLALSGAILAHLYKSTQVDRNDNDVGPEE